MARLRTLYLCQECGAQSPRWLGKCPECGAWGTVQEEAAPSASGRPEAGTGSSLLQPVSLRDIPLSEEPRSATGIPEFDRVLGGGLVPGAVILLGGEPGIGKSTLLLQLAGSLARSGRRVLYVTGEESLLQVRLRAERLNVDAPFFLLAETRVHLLLDYLETRPADLVIVDSIQTMQCDEVPGTPGSLTQVREGTARLARLAKEKHAALVLVGHVTKSGAIAGPKVVEHLVDTVLYFEGEPLSDLRVLRGTKNRFGSVNELGIFEMQGDGLRERAEATSFLFRHGEEGDGGALPPGSALTALLQGRRPFLLEIQALVSRTHFAVPHRRASGLDGNRLAMLLAVLEKRGGLNLFNQDVFVNVAGGLAVDEPASDLAVALAVAGSLSSRALPPSTLAWGEIGLSGEIRPAPHAEARAEAARRLGIQQLVVPRGSRLPALPGLRCHEVSDLGQALAWCRGQDKFASVDAIAEGGTA